MKSKILSAAAVLCVTIGTTGCAYNGMVEHHYDRYEQDRVETEAPAEHYQFYRADFSNCEPNGKFKIRIHH